MARDSESSGAHCSTSVTQQMPGRLKPESTNRSQNVWRKVRGSRVGQAQLLLQSGYFLKIDCTDDIDYGELTRLTRKDCKTCHLVIVHCDVDTNVLVLLLIMNLHQLSPRRLGQL